MTPRSFFYNLATLIMLFVSPAISINWMNTVTVAGFVLSTVLTALAREQYLRSNIDRAEALATPAKSINDAE